MMADVIQINISKIVLLLHAIDMVMRSSFLLVKKGRVDILIKQVYCTLIH